MATRQSLRHIVERLRPRRSTLGLGAILVVALGFRLWDLGTLPYGLHGDEATTGLEARRVLDEGWIGVYSPSALGQPAGPFYAVALSVGLLGNSAFAVRIVSALVGTATVALVFFVVRRHFDSRLALTAAGVLALLPWHVHFSRVGFGVIWWPAAVLVGIACIARATESADGRTWFMAGGAASLGLYTYNSHWLAGVSFALFLAVWLKRGGFARARAHRHHLAMFGTGGLLVGLPMFTYVLDRRNAYFHHFDYVDRRQTHEWVDASALDKVWLGVGWYCRTWKALLVSAEPDGVDGAGVIPQIPLLIALAFAIGLIVLLIQRRTAFVGLMLVLLAVLPLASAFTLDAQLRRNFAMAPLVAIVAAAGMLWVFDQFRVASPRAARVGAVAVTLVVAWTSGVSYFGEFSDSIEEDFIFAPELADAVELVRDAEDEAGSVAVYFMSGRHSFGYEVFQFQLEGVRGVDRSAEFNGTEDLSIDPSSSGRPLFVLVGAYRRVLPALIERYPGGEVLSRDGAVPVTAYLLAD